MVFLTSRDHAPVHLDTNTTNDFCSQRYICEKTVKRRLFQSYDEEPVSGKVTPGAVDNPSRHVGHGLAYHAPH